MGYLLDVWGEGRIDYNGVVSGFSQAMNINHRNKRISNGPDKNGPIHHLLAIDDYENPVFPTNDKFDYITVMAAPISRGTAREMCRVLKPQGGVIYLYDVDGEHNINFASEASQFGIYFQKRVFARDIDPPFNEIKLSSNGETNLLIYGWGHNEL